MSIRILPINLVNQIAAGEVVERPASALKELLENAIDAGATRIDIVATDGGKTYLSVQDNGSGMTRDDLSKSILRYATSKLPDDHLQSIGHLGFRGEAVPSIASVSKLKITTNNGEESWSIEVLGGVNGEPKPASIPKGTKVEVAELFYNVPARLKFLKTDRGEAAAIIDVVERLALCYPDVEFNLNESLRLPKADRLSRATQILGKDFKDQAIQVDEEHHGLRIEGFIARPTYSMATSAGQYFFVNGRSVKDKLLYQAIRAGFMDTQDKWRFAVVCLWLSLPPAELDVNVHPQKAEIRFKQPDLVKGSLVKCIREHIAAAPAHIDKVDPIKSFLNSTVEAAFAEVSETSVQFNPLTEEDISPYALGSAAALIHNKFIISRTLGGMAVIDMHAAHERIVYERLKQGALKGAPETQILLIPETVELPAKLVNSLSDLAPELANFGLVIEPFGETSIMIRETPAILKKANFASILKDLAEMELTENFERKLDLVAKTYACHTSIRSGQSLTVEEMNELLRQVEACPNAGQCNHGRRAYVEIPLKDLDKLFDR